LFTWHWGVMRRWPEALTHAAGYAFMALGMLTKGMQAPAYFLAAIVIYRVLTGQWRRLFSAAHLLGALAGAVLLLAWLVPYGLTMGWPAVAAVWTADKAYQVNGCINDWDWQLVATHLLKYPLEIAAGTLPWSLLLLLFLRGDFRRAIGAARPHVLFLSICLAVAFPTCWIPPGGLPRYFAPLFPCLAVLIGLAVQRCVEADAWSPLRAAWRRYLTATACLMIVAATAVVMTALCWAQHPVLSPWAETPIVALAYAVACLGLALLIFRIRKGGSATARLAVLAVACFMTMTFAGVVADIRLRRSEDAAEAVRRVKELLPPGQQLVSLGGHTGSLFAYHYGQPFIVPRPWPTSDADADWSYFCFLRAGDTWPALPFAWEEIGTVSLDRTRHAVPERAVVVGRRLKPEPSAQAGEPVLLARSEE